MDSNRASIKSGAISILALVIAVCLCILALLSFSTVRATTTLTDTQISFSKAGYANEYCAQRFVSYVDDELARLQAEGASPSIALNHLREVAPDLVNRSAKDASGIATTHNSLSGVAEVSETSVQNAFGVIAATFTAPNGKSLSIKLLLSNENRCIITSWKSSTVWLHDEQDNQTLWRG